MEEQRFAPLLAVVADVDTGPEVPDSTLKKIRQAWIACLVSAAITPQARQALIPVAVSMNALDAAAAESPA